VILICLLLSRCNSQKKNILTDKNLYWGDIHNHCNVGYAKGSLERAYDIAQSHLDFFCFTPHTQWHDRPDTGNYQSFTEGFQKAKNDWWKVVKYANDFYKPGKFVSFIGYEWHSSSYGDNCIIMPGNKGDLLYPGDIKELQSVAKENNALLIPHHPAYMKDNRGQNWAFLGQTDITPVVEIISEHGNAESDRSPIPYILHSHGGRYTRNTIQYLWSQGKQVGIVGSSDDHFGYPGAYGEGLVAVYADTLTRESIMEAIKNRRTYAVNADRIELDFRLNEHFMGESIPFKSGREISVKVKGKDVIERVEVLRNNSVIYRDYPCDRKIKDTSWDKPVLCRIEFGWGPWSAFNITRTVNWTFDVNIKNGKIISATPCFQSGPFDENRRNLIASLDDYHCKFQSYTSRKDAFELRPTNSVILEIQGSPETELDISLSQPVVKNHKILLHELEESSDIFYTGNMPLESVLIHRIVFNDNYQTDFKFKDKSETEITDWYYVRVVQTNGSLAWSSPVWVNKKEN